MEDTRVGITDMSCATCAQTVEEAVGDLDGVTDVSANFATDEARVEYDSDAVSVDEIHAAIRDAGYTPDTAETTIPVADMTCATCAQTVADAAEDVPGVVDADANFATDEARVEYDSAADPVDEIADAIRDAGYTPETDDEEDEADDDELASQRRLVIGGGILTLPFVPVMAAMLGLVTLPETILGVPRAWIEFVLAAVLMGTLGREFIAGAWRAAVNAGRANMDTLIAIGTTTAFVYSTASVLGFTPDGGLYFEAVAFILWFVTTGEYLESRSKARAGDAIRELLEMQADTAIVIDDEGNETEVPVEEVEPGDRLRVRPGERIPVDGVVRDGESAVNESMVTGESAPVDKEPGDEVIGGTVSENGVLEVEATKVGEDAAIQQIVDRVRDAQSRQPDVQRAADRISAYFVPAVILNALLWLGLWFAFPDALYGAVTALPLWEPVAGGPPAVGSVEFAVVVFAAAIIIACPCALGLATPAATMVGTSIAARNGVLFDGGDVLERARDADAVVFDKTGTLTEGEMHLADVESVGDRDAETVLEAAAAAERGSEHPIADAIVDGAADRDIAPDAPEGVEEVAGKGITATVDDRRVLVGSTRLLEAEGVDPAPATDTLERLEAEGKTAVAVAIDGEVAGVLAVEDAIRDSAVETVERLHDRGIDVWMLTGDNERTARAVAEQVGIPEENVRAEVLPEDKADAVDAIQSDDERAMMVGDGVNDAPALAAAHVGVAIGSGTDVAIESADVTLVRSDPADVLRVLNISDATLSKVRQNLFWALAYNTALIPVASLGLFNPALAGAAMAASDVSLMGNTLFFTQYEPDKEYVPLPLRPFR